MGSLKQVIVLRRDLDMGKGKMVAQGCHASVSAVLETLKRNREIVERWVEEGQRKIVVRVDSEEELLSVYRKALELGLVAVLVEDKGLTQLPPGTPTAVGIGPADEEIIDKVTGHLKLL
ncbi:peptidyl-tRNA hydrolase Pth2 [Thermofilum pendens]|uniref:Peptidyl-tRNA hydrolase n=1 Tax=Thermofilum pendens (strain DSM 2475 / Hrk 5) TaxID=368408 RepID=A1RY06_THEPD|nr:peptidyl-tRNA hydrolase Pth2 [Thermofilum pendens]ABL78086.1 Aminoacyl-tRNA hydrolase [Thermofilum pendens Hrk 5]